MGQQAGHIAVDDLESRPSPWDRIPAAICRILWARELRSSNDVNRLTDADLLEIEGIGPGRLARIREVFLGPTGPKASDGTVLIPQEHGGFLRPEGAPGNRGGGRPSNELRQRFRNILEVSQDEQVRRLNALQAEIFGDAPLDGAADSIEGYAKLRAWAKEKTHEELVGLVVFQLPLIRLDQNDLRLLMDTAAKYGIGQKHLHSLDLDVIHELMRRAGEVVRQHVMDPTSDPQETIARIHDDWAKLLPT